MSHELQELQVNSTESKKRIHPILWFLGGVLATLGAAFCIGHFFYQEPTQDVSPYEQKLAQLKEEIDFIRDQYGHFVAANEAKKEEQHHLKEQSEKLKSLEETFSQFKLALPQPNTQGENQTELFDHLSKLSAENKKIEDNQNLLIAFVTLKEIKSKITNGQLYEEEFKILRESPFDMEGLLHELIQRLSEPYPSLQEIKSFYKKIWGETQNLQQKNYAVSSVGNWIKITKTESGSSQAKAGNNFIKDDVYRDVLFALDTENFSQALEIVQGLPKEKIKYFDNWIKQVHQYLEGKNLQDHIDHWMRSTFKKIVTQTMPKRENS